MKNVYTKIESPNLMMRMLEFSDASALQKLLADNKPQMIPWIPWAGNEPEPVEVKKDKIRTWKGEFYLDKSYIYGIFPKSGTALIGLCFLFTRQGEGILEIGYVIDHQHTGKGYATECSYALSKLSFDTLKTEKVVIICDAANIASAKIPEKLGYALETTYKELTKEEDGQRKQIMIWAMYHEDFNRLDKYESIHLHTEHTW